MEASALKLDLIDKIKHANDTQLRELSGLLTNYFNGQDATEGWDTLPELHQKLILQGIEELDAGLGIPFEEATQKLRDKYGLNG